jgi:PAT family beta-lactamase induction signal transducer AmpG
MINFRKNFTVIFLLGISSGIPLSLVLSTLKAVLVDKNFDLKVIGFLSIVSIPYSLKLFIAPFVDSLSIPYLTRKIGNRRSWILLMQILLAIFITLLGISCELTSLGFITFFSFVVATISATQDIVIDGYRIEIIEAKEQAKASGFYIYGYRIGMLISGSLALIISEFLEWHFVYFIMTLFMILCSFATIYAQESRVGWQPSKYKFNIWFNDFIIEPFKNFINRKNWLIILIFIMLFKLADSFAGSLTMPFLLDLGFTKTDVAKILKTFGLFATLFGVYVGGNLNIKLGMQKSLWLAIILQAISNLSFLLLAIIGKNNDLLYLVVFIENFCGGLGDAIFVGYLSSICNLKFSATQYALLTSVASISRSFLSSLSGVYAYEFGWESFFIFSTILAIPAIALLIILFNNIKKLQIS